MPHTFAQQLLNRHRRDREGLALVGEEKVRPGHGTRSVTSRLICELAFVAWVDQWNTNKVIPVDEL